MLLSFSPDGTLTTIYTEHLDLSEFGQVRNIARASHVEPNPNSTWSADMSPCGGASLGPYARRSLALEAEVVWLEDKLLNNPSVIDKVFG